MRRHIHLPSSRPGQQKLGRPPPPANTPSTSPSNPFYVSPSWMQDAHLHPPSLIDFADTITHFTASVVFMQGKAPWAPTNEGRLARALAAWPCDSVCFARFCVLLTMLCLPLLFVCIFCGIHEDENPPTSYSGFDRTFKRSLFLSCQRVYGFLFPLPVLFSPGPSLANVVRRTAYVRRNQVDTTCFWTVLGRSVGYNPAVLDMACGIRPRALCVVYCACSLYRRRPRGLLPVHLLGSPPECGPGCRSFIGSGIVHFTSVATQ